MNREQLFALTCSRGELAKMFAVAENTINALVQRGMPAPVRHGEYLLLACVHWRRQDLKLHPPPGGTLITARLRLLDANRRHIQTAMAAQRKQLLHREEVGAVLSAILRIAGAELEALPGRVAGRVAMEADGTRIAKLLTLEGRQVRRRLAERLEDYAASLLPPGDPGGL